MESQKHSPKEFYPICYGFLGLYIVTAYKRGKRCFELAKNVQMWGNWRVWQMRWYIKIDMVASCWRGALT